MSLSRRLLAESGGIETGHASHRLMSPKKLTSSTTTKCVAWANWSASTRRPSRLLWILFKTAWAMIPVGLVRTASSAYRLDEAISPKNIYAVAISARNPELSEQRGAALRRYSSLSAKRCHQAVQLQLFCKVYPQFIPVFDFILRWSRVCLTPTHATNG